MKWTDEEIDQLFQDASAKVEAPYQDRYWLEMEALLPKKSTKKGFWWIFGLFFAMIGFVVVFFMLFKNDQPEDVLQTNLDEVNVVKNKSIEEDRVKDIGMNESGEESEGVNGHAVEDLNSISSNKDKNKIAYVDASLVVGLGTNHQDLIGFRSRSSKRLKNNDKEVRVKPQNQSPVFSIESGDVTKNTPMDYPDKSQAEKLTLENQTEPAQKIAEINVAAEKTDASNGNLDNDEVNVQTKEQESLSAEKLLEEIKNPIRSTSRYYIQAGASFAQSYLKTGKNELMSGVVIGFGYQYTQSGFGYSIGVNATSSFVQNMQLVRKSRVYGFGVENYEQNLKYKQLTYLSMPISFNYQYLKNTFSIGVAPTYLVSTRMNFLEFKNSEILSERSYYGQKIGLKTVGVETMIGYSRLIKNNWSLGIDVGFVLKQQIEDAYFEAKAVDFPFRGQVTLRKTLIPKK